MGNSLQSMRGGSLSEEQATHALALFNSFGCDWQVSLRGSTKLTQAITDAMIVPASGTLPDVASDRRVVEAAICSAYQLLLELVEHIFTGFPLLDRFSASNQ